MAIIRTIPRRRKLASYRGRVMIDTVRGVIRVRRWPKKRGKPKSEKQRFWIDWFTQANLLAKYADPMSQARAIEFSKDSGLYPRDILLQAMRGRLYTWADETGWRWFSVAAIQDLSDTLDVLAQTVGSILVRAVDRWRAPDPGNVDDVLTLKGTPPIPAWFPTAGGGGFQGGALVTTLANQSIPNATNTPIIWDSEQYDTDDLHDNTTNPSRLTVPAGWNYVRCHAGLTWASNSVNSRLLRFWMNGAPFPGEAMQRQRAIGTFRQATASPAIAVVEGDYFESVANQDRGSALNVLGPNTNTYFAMERAG